MDILFAPLEILVKSPGSWFVIAPVSIVAFVLELWPKFPSRYVYIVCLLLGALLYPFLEPASSVPATFPYPKVILVLSGFVLGFVAMVTHATLTKFLLKRFGPDTTTPENKPPPTNP